MFLSFQITFKTDQFKRNLKRSAPSADRLIGKIERELSGAHVMGNAKDIGCYGDTETQVSKPFGWRLKSNYRAAHHSHVTLC